MKRGSKEVWTGLFGPGRTQALRTLAITFAVFVIVAGLGVTVKVGDWVPEAFVSVTPTAVGISLVVVLFGCLGAGISASRNGGLLESWLFVLAPLAAWLFVYQYDAAHPLSTVVVVTAVALLTVPFAGTVAHTVGRLAQLHKAGDTWPDSTGPVLRFLIGPSPKRTGQWGLLAATLFIIAVGGVMWDQFPILLFFPFGAIAGAPLLGTGVTLAWVGLAVIPGYRNEGLLSSWVLIFGPIFGGVVTISATDQFMQLPLLVDAATTGVYVLVLALIVSVIGFLLGTFLRRISSSWRNGRQEAST